MFNAVWAVCQLFNGGRLSETRGPWATSPPEKTVQINKHIRLYHNVD